MILILIGLALFIILIPFKSFKTQIITPAISLLSYISYFLILFSVFLFSLKSKKILIGNLALLLLLVLILEIICFILLGMPDKYVKDFSASDLPPEHVAANIGYVPYADSVLNEVKVVNNDTVYNIHASIDKYNKRITPGNDSTRNKYALFFGCSICYGSGLEDNQTFPYYFQEESKEYNAYNFGYGGYGTNQMLARLEYQDLSHQVIGKDGVAFYLFFWDHIKRAIGSMDRYTDWCYYTPYYTFENGTLVRKKMFTNGRPFISFLYEWLYQTSTIKYFKIDFPVKLKDRHYDLISEIIKKSKETYAKQFGNNNFYVVFYPTYKDYTAEEFNRFKSYLERKGIKYIDLSEFIKYGPEYTLIGDPHPNANTNKMIAVELLKRLKQQ
jgi:hypothetical protein